MLAVEAIDDPMLLARRYSTRAVQRLGQLIECNGRQAQVAVSACKVLLEFAYPKLDEERVRLLVEAKLNALIAEADRRRLAAPPTR